jgi:protein-S-isoprenylcysteine O-methyltransferase Ste14
MKPAMRILARIRTAIYMTGFVVLWGWLALGVRRYDPVIGFELPEWVPSLGFALMAVGGGLALACGGFFAARGLGTPAPFDPPREFVAVGPYRYVRNPMYIGALLMLGGFGLIERSPSVLLLAAGAAILAHAFVVFVEEPGLERRFGESYREYTRLVRRWLPRLP